MAMSQIGLLLIESSFPLSVHSVSEGCLIRCLRSLLNSSSRHAALTALGAELMNSGPDLEMLESTSAVILPKRLLTSSLSVPFHSDSIRSTLLRTIHSLLPCHHHYELVGTEPLDFLVLDGCITRPTRRPRPTPRCFMISVMR